MVLRVRLTSLCRYCGLEHVSWSVEQTSMLRPLVVTTQAFVKYF